MAAFCVVEAAAAGVAAFPDAGAAVEDGAAEVVAKGLDAPAAELVPAAGVALDAPPKRLEAGLAGSAVDVVAAGLAPNSEDAVVGAEALVLAVAVAAGAAPPAAGGAAALAAVSDEGFAWPPNRDDAVEVPAAGAGVEDAAPPKREPAVGLAAAGSAGLEPKSEGVADEAAAGAGLEL